ncbi:MAG TPA: glycosyl hydrolase family 8 [Bacteroidota bacterium]|nr:glycosyl hydrolase family 8 [Bacteroidota bacterium]
MIRHALTVGLLALAGCSSLPSTTGGSLSRGALETGVYPDLFRELLSHDSAETEGKISRAWAQLFEGDSASERIYYPVGSDMGYVEDIANGDVRTEGMSYGMMIAAQLGRRDVFDRLWRWARTHMRLASGAHAGYFAWHCTPQGAVLDSTAASDGEEWFVTSLLVAASRWPDGARAYEEDARAILHTMLHKEEEPLHGGVTNMFDSLAKLVVFVPSKGGNGFTDPSYQLPHFYRLWARRASEDGAFWTAVEESSRTLIRRAAHPRTGLSPDYAAFDGSPVGGWRGSHADFRFDAWRVAMNVAMDWVWCRSAPWEQEFADRLLTFFRSQGMNTYGNQYTLGGKPLGKDHSTGLVAANAVAALAARGESRVEFVRALWDAPVPRGLYRYYDGMLYMLGLLEVSGRLRAYEPAGGSPPPVEGGAR